MSMSFILSPAAQAVATPWILLAGSFVGAILLVLILLWLRSSRRDRHPTQAETSNGAADRRDEITQPLTTRTRQQTSHAEATGPASLVAAARTDRGKTRSVNEDDTLLADLKDPETGHVRLGLYAVADGMGGHEKGEVASHTAIEATIQALEEHPFLRDGGYAGEDVDDESVLEVLREAVTSANRAVYAKKLDQRTDMGTTVVLALVMHLKAYVANVGDSRAYLVREGHIRQLTEDHSLVERMVASGQITPAEARLHPQRNFIFRSLGADPQVEVDLFVERLQPGDRLLLCSDGLSGMVPDRTIAHIVGRESDLDAACRLLIRAANDAGGKDNISVVLIEVLEPDADSQ